MHSSQICWHHQIFLTYYDQSRFVKYTKRQKQWSIIFNYIKVCHPRCVKSITQCIYCVFTYSCETWLLKETIINKLLVLERKILRKIFRPNNENGIWRIKTNQELEEHNKLHPSTKTELARLHWKDARYGNVKGNLLLETHIKKSNRKTKGTLGGDDVRKDIQKIKVPNWKTLAQDRRRWKELVEKAKTL